MKTLCWIVLLSLAAPLRADEGALGRPAQPGAAARTIEIDMLDAMRFAPAAITVKQGETVRFVVHNKGRITHEMMLGTMEELKAHAAAMAAGQAHARHGEAPMLRVHGRKAGEMAWQFTRAGEVYFGCPIPGHMEEGMVGKITVTP